MWDFSCGPTKKEYRLAGLAFLTSFSVNVWYVSGIFLILFAVFCSFIAVFVSDNAFIYSLVADKKLGLFF